MPRLAKNAAPHEPDLGFQTRTWRAQRVGWWVFTGIIAAALAGLFGSGPLSRTSAGTGADGVRVEYERFARALAPTMLTVRVGRALIRDGEIAIALSGDFVRAMELQSAMPPPDRTSLAPDGVVLRFRVDQQPDEMAVALHAKPLRPGILSSRIGVQGGPAHDINQWIYP